MVSQKLNLKKAVKIAKQEANVKDSKKVPLLIILITIIF